MRSILPLPACFQEKAFGDVYSPDIGSIEIVADYWAHEYSITNYAEDKKKICLVPIDVQNSFCIPGYSLYVGGKHGFAAVVDSCNLAKFIYQNLDVITEIIPSLDTHLLLQIFFPHVWISEHGRHPKPNTILTYRDGGVFNKDGVSYRANPEVAATLTDGDYAKLSSCFLHYVKKLTEDGKFPLIIWNYHTMLGTIGHAMVAGVYEAVAFHSFARHVNNELQIKGMSPFSENYSIFSPEVLVDQAGNSLPGAHKNSALLEKLLKFDAVIIAGQAKSHCVSWSIQHLLDEINLIDPSLAKKIYLLDDCTSPVVIPGVCDFTEMANEAFANFAKAGMNIVKSTDQIESWPWMEGLV